MLCVSVCKIMNRFLEHLLLAKYFGFWKMDYKKVLISNSFNYFYESLRDYFLLFPECLTALTLRAKFKSGDKAEHFAGSEKRPQQQPSPVARPANDVTDEELVSELSKVEAAMTQG